MKHRSALLGGVMALALCTAAQAQNSSIASGLRPITGAISSASTDGQTFTPVAGRPFNVSGTSSGAAGTCQLERQLGGAWYPTTVSAGGSTIQTEYWSLGGAFSDTVVEPQFGVPYRINCSSTVTGGGWLSGTLTYRIEQ